MNEVAYVVCKSIRNEYCKVVRVGHFNFRIYQPFVKDLCFIFGDRVSLNEDLERVQIISFVPHCSDRAIDILSKAIFKNKFKRLLFRWYTKQYADFDQIKNATSTFASIVRGDDLFNSVKFEDSSKKSTIETIGNNCLGGIIVTLMDSLHMSYREVLEQVNYPTLLLMSADKIRTPPSGEEKKKKVSGKDMIKRKGHNKNM